MTTIPVERELLGRVASALESRMCIRCDGVICCMTDVRDSARELRAMLAEQPQAGAVPVLTPVEREVGAAYEAWKLDMESYGFSGLDAFQVGAAWQRAQTATRQEHGDEVRRLRDALTTAANRLDRLTLEAPGGYWREQAAEWTAEARAALTHSQQGAEE